MIKNNDKGDIICNVCGAALKQITPSHLATHGITLKQYRKDYTIKTSTPLTGSSVSRRPKVVHG